MSRALDIAVTHHRVAIRNWSMPPLRIALVSDTHAGRSVTTLAVLERLVAQVNALGADLILHGGDFIMPDLFYWRAVPPRDAVAPFSALSAPLGVYAVLGNHDWKDDPSRRAGQDTPSAVIDALAEAGIALLENAGHLIPFGDSAFYLCGTGSRQGEGKPKTPARYDDLDAALEAAPTDVPRLLLAHEPDTISDAAGRVDLQMSGHTHRGQLDILGWRPISPSLLPSRHVYGKSQWGETTLIVSAGIGYSGLPLRIAAPPEITLIEISGA